MTPGWISFLLVLVLGSLCPGIYSQQYFYTTNYDSQPQSPIDAGLSSFPNFNRQQRQQEIRGGSQSGTGRGTSGNNRNNNNARTPVGNNKGNLQEQFAEIFNWNNDLTNDPRFQSCTVPDITEVGRACPKRAFYFGLNPQHRRAVGMVKNILTQPHNPSQTICLAGRMRDLPGMNPNVWIRGMLGAHLSDVGLFDLQVPPIVEVMPHIFLNSESLQQAKRQAALNPPQRTCTVIDGSAGRDNGVENLLWYFREDVQLNSFHLNWHLVYPFTGVTQRADRRGELFYFSHHSHLARYHAERLSNGLGRVVPLNINNNVRVPESFHPHLTDINSAMSWTPRRPSAVLQDTIFIAIEGVPPNISVADRSLHVQRVEQSIDRKTLLLANGQTINLNSRQGIDVLGDVVESSIWSPNPEFYGAFGFHNEGHVLLSLIEDPQNRSSVPPGVMLEVATAMRDPVFYTYHTSMDETFDRHKRSLAPYQPDGGELPLRWEGIEITNVQVLPDDGGFDNTLTTFFNRRTFELSRGLDFNRSGVQGAVQACVTHLDHSAFTYRIYANRKQHSSTDRATVRIFLAPRFDEKGRRYMMLEQRQLFFMLDLFTVRLQVGPNRITRRSVDSSLTIDIPQSLTANQNQTPRTYCGCGWPHHLLIPKGTEKGMTFDLFVMLTNGDEDYVPPRRSPQTAREGDCKPAPIYCGRLNDTYPDSRPMGYPFDRLPYNYATRNWWEPPRFALNLNEYVQGIPNMATTQIQITHTKQPTQILAQNSDQFDTSSATNVNNHDHNQGGQEGDYNHGSPEYDHSHEHDHGAVEYHHQHASPIGTGNPGLGQNLFYFGNQNIQGQQFQNPPRPKVEAYVVNKNYKYAYSA